MNYIYNKLEIFAESIDELEINFDFIHSNIYLFSTNINNVFSILTDVFA